MRLDETPLAHLRTLIEQHIAEEIGGPNASYCWFCHRDVNGVEGPQEEHAPDCWMIQVRALLTDLEAAPQTEKDEELSRAGGLSPAQKIHVLVAEIRRCLHNDQEKQAHRKLDAIDTLLKMSAGEAVASRHAAQEPTQSSAMLSWAARLVRAVADPRLARNLDEEVAEPVRQIAMQMKSAAYRLNQAAAAPAVEGARPQEEKFESRSPDGDGPLRARNAEHDNAPEDGNGRPVDCTIKVPPAIGGRCGQPTPGAGSEPADSHQPPHAGVVGGGDDDKAETYRRGWEAGHADGLTGRAGGREDALLPILIDMQKASDEVDTTNGTSDYPNALTILALIARHYLRERAALHARTATPETK